MDPELLEIRRHLASHPPFEALSDELLDSVAEHIEIHYYRAGSQILEAGQSIESLQYVRSGAVEIYRRTGALFDRLGEGGIFRPLRPFARPARALPGHRHRRQPDLRHSGRGF